jgi:hypothetical protein
LLSLLMWNGMGRLKLKFRRIKEDKDLWNLMPAHRMVNLREKRERLPADGLLRASSSPIQDWRRRGYLKVVGPALPRRFSDEARASLLSLAGGADLPRTDEVFATRRVQRMRLHHDQQVPKWTR